MFPTHSNKSKVTEIMSVMHKTLTDFFLIFELVYELPKLKVLNLLLVLVVV